MNNEIKSKIIHIDGVENFRDLGGYPARAGKKIRYGKFFRAAALHTMTPKGKEDFNKLGIEYIVDLRSQVEREQDPENIDGLKGVTHVHVPMLDHLNSSLAGGVWEFPESMQAMYSDMLEAHKEEFKRLFELFATATGGIVFHCTAGKDRTGVLTMLLYSLAGVENQLIAEDYSYSQHLLSYGGIEPPEGIPSYVNYTKPEYMRDTIAWLEENYNGGIGYLENIGISEETLRIVSKQLGVPFYKDVK